MQRRHHRHAQEGFGKAKTAKYGHFFDATLYPIIRVLERVDELQPRDTVKWTACLGLPMVSLVQISAGLFSHLKMKP